MSDIRGRRVAGRVLIGLFALLLLAAAVTVVATGGLAEDWWLIALAAAALIGAVALHRWTLRKLQQREGLR